MIVCSLTCVTLHEAIAARVSPSHHRTANTMVGLAFCIAMLVLELMAAAAAILVSVVAVAAAIDS